MKKKLFLSLWVFAWVFIFLFTGFSPASADEKIEIKFFHAMKGNREKILNSLIEKFNNENPEIEVKGMSFTSKSDNMGNDYNALYKAILENTAKKDPPDIAQVYENWTVQLIEIGVLDPIEDFVGSVIPEEEIEDLVPVFREANTFNGKLWTLPFNKSIYVLYYNKDMLDEAGVKPPADWREFKEASLKLTRRNGDETNVYGFAFQPSVDMFGHYLYSYGGEFIEGNLAVFNSPIGIEDLKFWVDMVHEDRTALVSFSDRTEFEKGRCAMYIDTTSRIKAFNRSLGFNWDVSMLPQGTQRRYQVAGTNLALFSHLDPKKKSAAAKFIHFMANRETTLFWALNTGYLPVMTSAINSPEYGEAIQAEKRYGIGIESLKYATVQPKVAGWEMIRGIIDDAMYEAMSLRNTPDEALNRAASMSNQLLENISGRL